MKDIRALLKDYKKIKLVTLMDKVGFGFTVAKALYDEGAVTYDEELKIKRNFKKRDLKIFQLSNNVLTKKERQLNLITFN